MLHIHEGVLYAILYRRSRADLLSADKPVPHTGTAHPVGEVQLLAL